MGKRTPNGQAPGTRRITDRRAGAPAGPPCACCAARRCRPWSAWCSSRPCRPPRSPRRTRGPRAARSSPARAAIAERPPTRPPSPSPPARRHRLAQLRRRQQPERRLPTAGASAVTLNRVTGPDPSAIAGRISANGQVVLTNPSGVVFTRARRSTRRAWSSARPGSATRTSWPAAWCSTGPASPDARIDNAGTITVKQAGLAALVAPSVANSGVINARLGQVVLAGATTHTLDMYGDGLVSIDVTEPGARRRPRGPDGKPVTALVTNTGVIAADGGAVQLTAAAADGVVQTLVRAGGTIRANSDRRPGRADRDHRHRRLRRDRGPGRGGRARARHAPAARSWPPAATRRRVAPTARVTANGARPAAAPWRSAPRWPARAAAARRRPAPPPAPPSPPAPASRPSGTPATGDGGRVTVLSTQITSMGGTITARGGTHGRQWRHDRAVGRDRLPADRHRRHLRPAWHRSAPSCWTRAT